MTARPSLSILMPAFDEQAGIRDAVDACLHHGDELMHSGQVGAVEVVVVDDGSTDLTAVLLDEMAAREPRLRVVHHRVNRGLGAALRSGFECCSGEVVFYTDADLPVHLSAISTALELLDDDVDAVCAYRRRRRGEGARRFAYSMVYNSMCRLLLGVHLRDVNFAAKLLRTHQVRSLGLRSDGSFIDAELIGRLQGAGGVVRQFAATYRPRSRGISTLSSLPVVLHILREFAIIGPQVRRRHILEPSTA